MLYRIFALAVVLFWAGSLVWLGAVIWAPPESRMAKIDAREVYTVFFGWNDSTNMTLLENGKRRGQITITGGSGDDPETGEFSNSLSFSGSLETPPQQGQSPRAEFLWRGVIDFAEDLKPSRGQLSVRVPDSYLGIRIELVPKTDSEALPGIGSEDPVAELAKAFDFTVAVQMRDAEIFSFDSANAGSGTALPLAMLPMGLPAGIDAIGPEMLDFDFDVTARNGEFTLGGREVRAYLLDFRRKNGEEALRVYLSEAGEPLRVETGIGLEALSEILVPLDAFSRSEP